MSSISTSLSSVYRASLFHLLPGLATKPESDEAQIARIIKETKSKVDVIFTSTMSPENKILAIASSGDLAEATITTLVKDTKHPDVIASIVQRASSEITTYIGNAISRLSKNELTDLIRSAAVDAFKGAF